jgi:hypothetical protein
MERKEDYGEIFVSLGEVPLYTDLLYKPERAEADEGA